MTLEAALAGARFVHLTCAIVLFGGALFVLYTGLHGDKRPSLALPRMLVVAAIGELLSGAAWFALTAANMSGALADALDHEILTSVLWETNFGHLWAVRLILTALLLAGVIVHTMATASDRARPFLAVLAAILLASLAGTGHTQTHADEASTIVHVIADAVHLLAAGAWLGGLLPLGLFLRFESHDATDETVLVLSRFSGMGYAAVAALLISGTINGWFLVGSPENLVATSYGRLLLLKVALFGLMVLLAASNRFWLVPALARPARASGGYDSMARLRRHVLGEQALGVFIVGVVSVLGTLSPAIQPP